MRPSRSVRRASVALVIAAAAGLTACGGGTSAPAPVRADTARSASPATWTAPAWPRRAFPRAGETLVVRREPAVSARVAGRLAPRTPLGSLRVVLALGQRGGWLRVALPTRPNGSTGWVRAADVRLEPVAMAITVDLRARRLTLTDGPQVLADAVVAIGAPAYPTPRGRFYVTDRVRPDAPNGPYGSFALGLSAHSPTLSEFEGSDAQVAVHGANDPSSIGGAVSHGCIRVGEDVAPLLAQVPLGTPVTVR